VSAQINLPRCAMGCGSTFGLDRSDLPWVWRNGLPPGVPTDRICEPCKHTLSWLGDGSHLLRQLDIVRAEGPGRDA